MLYAASHRTSSPGLPRSPMHGACLQVQLRQWPVPAHLNLSQRQTRAKSLEALVLIQTGLVIRSSTLHSIVIASLGMTRFKFTLRIMAEKPESPLALVCPGSVLAFPSTGLKVPSLLNFPRRTWSSPLSCPGIPDGSYCRLSAVAWQLTLWQLLYISCARSHGHLLTNEFATH